MADEPDATEPEYWAEIARLRLPSSEDDQHAASMRQIFESWEQRFGQRIREWRVARSWSQDELAARLRRVGIEMHQTTVAKIERGSRPLRVAEAVALAEVMGMPVLSVFHGSGPEDVPMGVDMMRDRLELIEERIEFTQNAIQEQYRLLASYETDRILVSDAINRAALKVDTDGADS